MHVGLHKYVFVSEHIDVDKYIICTQHTHNLSSLCNGANFKALQMVNIQLFGTVF